MRVLGYFRQKLLALTSLWIPTCFSTWLCKMIRSQWSVLWSVWIPNGISLISEEVSCETVLTIWMWSSVPNSPDNWDGRRLTDQNHSGIDWVVSIPNQYYQVIGSHLGWVHCSLYTLASMQKKLLYVAFPNLAVSFSLNFLCDFLYSYIRILK